MFELYEILIFFISLSMTHIDDWQISCVDLKARTKNLLNNEQLTDCTFVIGHKPDQVNVKSHKLILAIASPVFESMFYGSMSEKNTINITDIEPETFKALLGYIYCDAIDINGIEMAFNLYYAAKKYMLPYLVQECVKYMKSKLTSSNACRLYEIAKLFDETDLKKKSIETISNCTLSVLSDSSFEEIQIETMIDIFQMDNLTVNSELDIFNAALRYINAQEKKQISTVLPKDTKAKTENDIKKTMTLSAPSIRNAIQNIRFLTLNHQEFAGGPAKSGLLTEIECFHFFMNICLPKNDHAIPEGFTTIRNKRINLARQRPQFNQYSRW